MFKFKRLYVQKIIDLAITNLLKTPKEEWPRIYNTINCWQWDDALGAKPDGWDELPNYYYGWRSTLYRNRITKSDILNVLSSGIMRLIGSKELSKYHIVHNLGDTEDEFEDWWARQAFNDY